MTSTAGNGETESRPERPRTGHERIVRDAEIDQLEWDAFVEKHPEGCVYQLSEWRNVISETFGKQVHSVAAVSDEGQLLGVLSLVRLKLPPIVDMLVSLPYCNYAGLLAERQDVGELLLGEAAALAESLGCPSLEIRSRDPFDVPNWTLRRDKVRMILQLPDSADELGKMLGAKKRSQIRRPLREGATIHIGAAELVHEFYEVFARKMRDLGTPVYSREFFYNVVNALGERVRVVIVRIDDSPVAAAILIQFRNGMEIPWAASDRRYDRFSVNMFLYWHALVFAIEVGCTSFDFGRCTVDSGSYRFKLQWGTQMHELGWLCRGRPAIGSEEPRGFSVREAMTAAWQRLPLPLANWLGPKLTANLPW